MAKKNNYKGKSKRNSFQRNSFQRNSFDGTFSNVLNNFNLKKFGGKSDNDGDGVLNKFDCQPNNPMKQDKTYWPSHLKKRHKINFQNTTPRQQRILQKQFRKNPEILQEKEQKSQLNLSVNNRLINRGSHASISPVNEQGEQYRPGDKKILKNTYSLTLGSHMFNKKYDPKFEDYMIEQRGELPDKETLNTEAKRNVGRKSFNNIGRSLSHEMHHVNQVETEGDGDLTEFWDLYRANKEDMEEDADLAAINQKVLRKVRGNDNKIPKKTKDWFQSGPGASAEKQRQWGTMSTEERNEARAEQQDTDGDRVPDEYDCDPDNTMRQDKTYWPSHLKKKHNINFRNTTPRQKRVLQKQFRKNPELLQQKYHQSEVNLGVTDTMEEHPRGTHAYVSPVNVQRKEYKSGNKTMLKNTYNVNMAPHMFNKKFGPKFEEYMIEQRGELPDKDTLQREAERQEEDRGKKPFNEIGRTLSHEMRHVHQVDTEAHGDFREFNPKYIEHKEEYENEADIAARNQKLIRQYRKKEKPMSNTAMNWFQSGPGASEEKQQQWADMNRQERNEIRIEQPDTDGDRVPDEYDCDPDNTMKQDFTPFRDGKKAEEMTAARRFGGQNLKGLKKLGSGRDRDVYELDNDKVLKLAKNPGGLTQNQGESDVEEWGLGEHYETGKDYVVMKKNQPLSKTGKRKLSEVRREVDNTSTPQYRQEVKKRLSEGVLDNAGIGNDILNYDFVPGEMFANRQWGEDEQGQLQLNDAGALQDDVSLRRYRVKDFQQVDRMFKEKETPWQLQDWQDIQQQRRQFRTKGNFNPIRKKYSGNTTTVWSESGPGASEEKQRQWQNMSLEERNQERAEQQDTDGDRVPDEYDCDPDNTMQQGKFLGFGKKKEEKYVDVTDPEFRKEQEYKQSIKNMSQYGETKSYSGNTIGNTVIAVDTVLPTAKVLTVAGLGFKRYIDKVKLVKTDEHDNKYRVPRMEFHGKSQNTGLKSGYPDIEEEQSSEEQSSEEQNQEEDTK